MDRFGTNKREDPKRTRLRETELNYIYITLFYYFTLVVLSNINIRKFQLLSGSKTSARKKFFKDSSNLYAPKWKHLYLCPFYGSSHLFWAVT